MTMHGDDDVPNHKFRKTDDEAPDVRDLDGDQQEFIRCPNCRKYILEDAAQCPYCKDYVEEERQSSGKPVWVIVTAIICLLLALGWVLSGWVAW